MDNAKADYAALLESSTAVTNKLRKEVREVRSQLEKERADREEVEIQLSDRESEIAELRSELSDLKQKLATASKDLPEAAEVYNQFKAKNPKTKTTYGDVKKILAILEES